MKYESPKYEHIALDTTDIMAASGGDIQANENETGGIDFILDFSKLF